MNQTQYFTLTQMIIDDVYFPWGATKLNQLGGRNLHGCRARACGRIRWAFAA